MLTGGGHQGTQGFFVQPTILINPPKSSRVYREEVFGPVLVVRNSRRRRRRLSSLMRANMVSRLASIPLILIGLYGSPMNFKPVVLALIPRYSGCVGCPFGGFKANSGYGRGEPGKAVISAYTQLKAISINL